MSASTGAPIALARSEGSIDATNGTALATLATPPAQVVAMRILRRARLTSGFSLIGKLLLEGMGSKAEHYIKNTRRGPNFLVQLHDFKVFYQAEPGMLGSRCSRQRDNSSARLTM